jgi:hypothetical protein
MLRSPSPASRVPDPVMNVVPVGSGSGSGSVRTQARLDATHARATAFTM